MARDGATRSEKTVNGKLIKQLARLQQDNEPAIRTNGLICMARIANMDECHLNNDSIQKFLLPSFVRALKVRGRRQAPSSTNTEVLEYYSARVLEYFK